MPKVRMGNYAQTSWGFAICESKVRLMVCWSPKNTQGRASQLRWFDQICWNFTCRSMPKIGVASVFFVGNPSLPFPHPEASSHDLWRSEICSQCAWPATVVAAVVEEGGVAAKPETFRAECLNSRMKRSNVWASEVCQRSHVVVKWTWLDFLVISTFKESTRRGDWPNILWNIVKFGVRYPNLYNCVSLQHFNAPKTGMFDGNAKGTEIPILP